MRGEVKTKAQVVAIVSQRRFERFMASANAFQADDALPVLGIARTTVRT